MMHSKKEIFASAEQYFMMLDEDRDDIINSHHINIESIDIDKLRILFPIFQKIEKYNLTLTFD